jgi:hypothetical protein
MSKIEPLHSILPLKELAQRPRKNIEDCKREKSNKGKTIKITDFSTETLKEG